MQKKNCCFFYICFGTTILPNAVLDKINVKYFLQMHCIRLF